MVVSLRHDLLLGRLAVPIVLARLDDARQAGVELGAARFDDDDWAVKLELLIARPVPVVSFTFGCPEPELDPEVIKTRPRLMAALATAHVRQGNIDEACRLGSEARSVLRNAAQTQAGHTGS